MRDLEIRGAGSLLGAEQSGHVSAVGFDLYAEMLKDAVAELTGESIPRRSETKVDLPVAAFLPEEYLPAVDERVLAYRRIATAPDEAALEAVRASLEDRYGPLPEQARNLITIASIRIRANVLGITSLALIRRRLRIEGLSLASAARGELAARGAVVEPKGTVFMPCETGEVPLACALRALHAIEAALASARS